MLVIVHYMVVYCIHISIVITIYVAKIFAWLMEMLASNENKPKIRVRRTTHFIKTDSTLGGL